MIARSYDAKEFVNIGAPYFQIKDHLRRNGVVAFSSNYALYGDVSERVMTIIESMVPALEVYSIDEAFADLTGIPGDLIAFGRTIRAAIYKRTGIAVGLGIARTKTLAKLANHTAKRLSEKTGGVVDSSVAKEINKILFIANHVMKSGADMIRCSYYCIGTRGLQCRFLHV